MAPMLKGQMLRTVILSRDDLADIHDLLARLSKNDSLTAVETGVADEEPVTNLTLIGTPVIVFDGFNWNVFLYYSTA